MKTVYDLSSLDWKLSGWTPHVWRLERTAWISASPNAEIASIPAKVPGSVQYSLRQAGLLPDWNVGLNYRNCEWVENRHWVYEAAIPDDWALGDAKYRLNCQGLDYSGWVMVNGREVSQFRGSHVPHAFDITPFLQGKDNVLRIVFDLPPRWLGQFGYTSMMTDWKPRFNYTWDWTVRLVQIGIWDAVFLEKTRGSDIESFRATTDVDPASSSGSVVVKGKASASQGSGVRVSLSRGDTVVCKEDLSVSCFNESGLSWSGLPVDLWWPNMMGDQPVYTLLCELLDENGKVVDRVARKVGFRSVRWRQCEGARADAYPNLCVVNGRPVFLQGVNWTPILPNFADVTGEDYRRRLALYRDLGVNILRVWGGATLEREIFYDLCDEMGIMVWQEFPMSSSGTQSLPPEDEKAIEEMAKIAESYICRREHHPSLIIWCGGNELQWPVGSEEHQHGAPVDDTHPMIARLKEVAAEEDPSRRFLFTSPSGPVFCASPDNFGKGIHWHVHGPWKADGDLGDWADYWQKDDSMLRSETGSPGASSAEMTRNYAGEYAVMPARPDNPLWRRTSIWWIEWDQFISEHGREPADLDEYVAWSQNRQAEALSIAVRYCKDRFPRCGGVIIWMGHDCFPCTANTSIVDFQGNPKPAALALKEIWRNAW